MHPSSILVGFGSAERMVLVYVHFNLPFTECMDGRFGWNCLTPCQKGFYGHLCRKSCECNVHFCDPVKGCNTSGLFSKSATLDVIIIFTFANVSLNDLNNKIDIQFCMNTLAFVKFYSCEAVIIDEIYLDCVYQ